MSDWQPIEPAPKDGTVVLFFEPKHQWGGRGRWRKACVTIGYWHQPANSSHPGFWCSSVMSPYRPTHWMPLPSPPMDEATSFPARLTDSESGKAIGLRRKEKGDCMRTVTPERAAQMIAKIPTRSLDPKIDVILWRLEIDIEKELARHLRQPKTKTR